MKDAMHNTNKERGLERQWIKRKHKDMFRGSSPQLYIPAYTTEEDLLQHKEYQTPLSIQTPPPHTRWVGPQPNNNQHLYRRGLQTPTPPLTRRSKQQPTPLLTRGSKPQSSTSTKEGATQQCKGFLQQVVSFNHKQSLFFHKQMILQNRIGDSSSVKKTQSLENKNSKKNTWENSL